MYLPAATGLFWAGDRTRFGLDRICCLRGKQSTGFLSHSTVILLEEKDKIMTAAERTILITEKRVPCVILLRVSFWLLTILVNPNLGQQYELQQFFNGKASEGQHHQQRQAGDSVSIRIIDEIMEIFVPPESFGARRSPADGNNVNSQPMPIPYGLNRLLPRTARSKDSSSERTEQSEFLPAKFNPIRNDFGNGQQQHQQQEQQAPWAQLAREVLTIFRGSMDTTTPSTTTTTTQLSLLERIMPKFLNPFGLGTTSVTPPTGPPLFPFFTKAMTTTTAPSLLSFFRQEQPKKQEPTNPLILPMAQLFGVEKKAVEDGRAQIDTGGPSFDRFVVREKLDHENPLAAFVGGAKWNERGIKWEDGNIRLVNKHGNSFLGSELGVNDRSVDIPVRRWLDIANGLVSFNQAQQDRVRRW